MFQRWLIALGFGIGYPPNGYFVPDKRILKFGIVAGEPSGDLLGAGLITALSAKFPNAVFSGIGGPKMRAAGCDTRYDMDHIELMGFDGLLSKLGDILKIRSAIYRHFISAPLDLFIGIDVPDFNLPLERKLKKYNITTVHYVSPTVWAWRGYRIHKIRRAVNLMLTLFPFEAEYYQHKNIPVTCVGHPMADEIDQPDRMRARRDLGLNLGEDKTLIAILPGSRKSEVEKLGGLFVNAAERLSGMHPDICYVLPFANDGVAQTFNRIVGSINHLPITVLNGQSRLAIEASNFVLLASGTAALEAALLQRPHVVVYKLSNITYWLFRILRHVDYYSMPNHLLPNPVIPELIQNAATVDNIVAALNNYLSNPQLIQTMENQFKVIHKQLKLNANDRACAAIMKLLRNT